MSRIKYSVHFPPPPQKRKRGRPRKDVNPRVFTKLSDQIRDTLADNPKLAKELINALIERAKKGSIDAINVILERTEGKVSTSQDQYPTNQIGLVDAIKFLQKLDHVYQSMHNAEAIEDGRLLPGSAVGSEDVHDIEVYDPDQPKS